MKKFAAQSQDSANEIYELIDNTIKQINGAPKAESTATALVLVSVSKDIDKLTGFMNEIYFSPQRHGHEVKEISEEMGKINYVVSSNNSSTQAASASEEPVSQWDALLSMSKVFKLRVDM